MGSIRWICLLGLIFSATLQAAEPVYPTSLTIDKSGLYLSAEGVARYSRFDHQPIWRKLEKQQTHELVVGRSRLFVSGSSGVYAYHKRDGELAWQRLGMGPMFSPVLVGRRLYLAAQDGTIRALKAATGSLLWERRVSRGWVYPPVYHDGLLITGGQDARVLALRAEDGTPVWQTDVKQELVYAPLESDGRLYLSTFAGELMALDPDDGKVLSRYQLASPGVLSRGEGGAVFLSGMDGELRKLHPASSTVLWRKPLGGRLPQPVTERDGRLIAMNDEGDVLLLDSSTGATLASAKLPGTPLGAGFLEQQQAIIFFSGRNIPAPVPVLLDVTGRSGTTRKTAVFD